MIKTLLFENKTLHRTIKTDEIGKKLSSNALIWIDLENPDEKEINLLRNVFKFHHLAIEDCLNRKQRPKVDNYKDYYFMVLNAYREGDTKKGFIYSDIYFFMGKNYIVTLRWSPIEVMNRAYDRVVSGPDVFERGVDFILYTILDEIVDDYFPLTDKIGDRIDTLEELIIKLPKKRLQDDIMLLKRTIVKLKRILSPQREVVNILLRHDFNLINEENRLYFMDVYDHILRIFDLIDTYQDLLSSALDLYMSQISNRMNEIMKVLTIITTLMMPMTVISGIYGMNFQFMPGLQSRGGFTVTVILMIVIVVAELVYFKIKKWL